MPEVVKDNASKVLAHILKERGIKQVYVAQQIGMSSSSFSALLHSRKRFTADIAIQLGKVLHVPYNIFLNKSYL